MKTDPRPIAGPWDAGFTLDVHTLSSEFLGYDAQGHAQYDTVRSEVGAHLYRCKYRRDRGEVALLADVAADFVRAKKLLVDVVVPVPPSKSRSFQALLVIANTLAQRLGIEYDPNSLKKVKETPELKSMSEVTEREKALRDAFEVDANALRGRHVLLFDDLYRSDASMSAATRTLKKSGGVTSVTALAFTRTKNRS